MWGLGREGKRCPGYLREDMNVETYLGPREDWGFWMLSGSDRDKRQALRQRLETAGLRPTWQRMKIGLWVFELPTKHFTPEDLFREMQLPGAKANEKAISLATIYNTLNAFAGAGLLQVYTDKHGKRFYDTNTTRHYHLNDEGGMGLIDVPKEMINLNFLPELPEGYEVDEVLVTLRIKPTAPPKPRF